MSGGRDTDSTTGKKINLTRPNPPPIPPPVKEAGDNTMQQSEQDIVETEIEKEKNSSSGVRSEKSSRSSPLRISNDTYIINSSQLEEICKSQQFSGGEHSNSRTPTRLQRSPEKSPQSTKEHGYTPSFFQDGSPSSSHKIFLRREGSFGQMSDPGDTLQERNGSFYAGGESSNQIVTDENEQVQKIVQSDGTVRYASYRKVSLDRGSDADLESLEGSETLYIPGGVVDDSPSRPPPSPDVVKKTKMTIIDSDDNPDEVFQRSRRGRSSQR